jgi:hypothetical protein
MIFFRKKIAANSHASSQQRKEVLAYSRASEAFCLTRTVQNEIRIRIDRRHLLKGTALFVPVVEVRRGHRSKSTVGELDARIRRIAAQIAMEPAF